jgi:hypothetical protein
LLLRLPTISTPLGARAAAVAEERVRRWALSEAAGPPANALLPPLVFTYEYSVCSTDSPLAVSCCVLPAAEDSAPSLGVSLAISEDALVDNGEAAGAPLVLRWGAATGPGAPLLEEEEEEDDSSTNSTQLLRPPADITFPLDPSVASWDAGGGAAETTFFMCRQNPCNVGSESGKTQRGGLMPPLGLPAANAADGVHVLLLRLPLDAAKNAALCRGGLAFVLKTASRLWLSYDGGGGDGAGGCAGVRGGAFFLPTAAFAQLAGVVEEAPLDYAQEEQEAAMTRTEEQTMEETQEEQEQEHDAAPPPTPTPTPAEAAALAAVAAARAAAGRVSPETPEEAVAAAARAAIRSYVATMSGGSSGEEEEEEVAEAAAETERDDGGPAAASAADAPASSAQIAPAAATITISSRTRRVLEHLLAERPPDPPLVGALVRGAPPTSAASSPTLAVPHCSWAVNRIAHAEPNAERSLAHRFQEASRLLADAERELGADGTPRAALAVAAWLRFSSARCLVWNRNYNIKPREVAAAQDALTDRLLRLQARFPWLRAATLSLALPAVGRGGGGGGDDGNDGASLGQRVRDQILAVQAFHARCRGGLWEQWHQKLHNNTSPDDVAICRALIAFVEAGSDGSENSNERRLAAYWRVLEEHGITRERLASYDRAITDEPSLAPEQKRTGDTDASLEEDLKAYLDVLVAVHGGGGLSSAAQAVLGFELPAPSGGGGRRTKGRAIRVDPVPGVGDGEAGARLRAAVDSVLEAQRGLGAAAVADGPAWAAALAHARVVELAVEARLLLQPSLLPLLDQQQQHPASDPLRTRDVVLLDQALDLAARAAIEGGLQHVRRAAAELAGGRREAGEAGEDPVGWLLAVATPAVENAALSSAPPCHLSDAAADALEQEAAAVAEWADAPMQGSRREAESASADGRTHHHGHHHHPQQAPTNELALCLKHLHAIRRLPSSSSSPARPLHAVAVLERTRRVVSDGAAALCNWLQPTADALGAALPQIPRHAVELFAEEAVRGTAASALAQLLAVLEPLARGLAGQRGGWQVVSRGGGGGQGGNANAVVITGRLARAASLAQVQHASYAEPTILLVDGSPVRGEEDVPRGVVAVLVAVAAGGASSWGGLDVLCHAAIRARNSGALLACCLDDDLAAQLLAAADALEAAPLVSVELLAGEAGVVLRAAAEGEAAAEAAAATTTTKGRVATMTEANASSSSPLTLLAPQEFAPGLVGAKALNTAALSQSQRLPPWVVLPPWSLALPAGAFDAALTSDAPDNVPIAEALRDLSAAAEAALEAGDGEAASRALELARGAVLRMRAPEALGRAFASAVGQAAWEEHVERVERRRRVRATTTEDESDADTLFSPLSSSSWAAAAGDAAWAAAWPAIRRVWASQFNLRAAVALRSAGLDRKALRMAVLIQPLLPGARAFVAHTRWPFAGLAAAADDGDDDDDVVYVEVVEGLGETLVGAHPGRALGGSVKRSALRAAGLGREGGDSTGSSSSHPPAAPASARDLAAAVRVASVPSKSVVLRAPGAVPQHMLDAAAVAAAASSSGGDEDDDHDDDALAGQLAAAAAARLIARSDSNAEDLSGFAGAGLFDSHASRAATPALSNPADDPLFFGGGGDGGDDGDDDDGLSAARALLWDLAAASLAVEDALGVSEEDEEDAAVEAQDVEGVVVAESSAPASHPRPRRVCVVQARPQV